MGESLTRRVNWLKKNKLPKHINIGPYSYEVIICKNKDKRLKGKGDEDGVYFGRINHKHMCIYLAGNQKKQMMYDTLLHEVMHGIFTVVGGWGSGVEEEKVVSMFSTMLLDTLRKGKNPRLAGFLFNHDTN